MPFMRRNSLSKNIRTKVVRRRTGVIKRAKFQKPTARNQKSQIMGNALAIRSLKKLMPPPVYTDYQYSRGYGAFFLPSTDEYQSILCDQLMNMTDWIPVLRRDPNVITSSTTLVKRLQINMRYDLGQSSWAQLTTFIVSLRKDASDRDPLDTSTLVPDEDYILSIQQGQNPRLNPAVFKVHAVRNLSLMSNSWRENYATAGGSVFASNANTTFAKGQINLNLNFKLRQPTRTTAGSWKVMKQEQLPPHQRLYVLTFFKGSTAAVDDRPPAVFYDALFTCYNAS